jgi:hypothetical protein
MKTFKTNTNIWPICRCCTYWGPFDHEGLWGSREYELRREGKVVCDDFDAEGLRAAIAKCANTVISKAELLKDHGVRAIRVTGYDGPKYYNLGGDWLDFEVDVDDDFLDRLEKTVFSEANIARSEAYIRNHFRSRDGFISAMPDSVDEVHGAIAALKARPDGEESYEELRWFGAAIALLWNTVEPEGEDDNQEGSLTDLIVENFLENYDLGDFCTILGDDEVQRLYGDWLPDASVNGDLDRLRYLVDRYKASPKDSPDADEKAETLFAHVQKLADEVKAKARGIVAAYHMGKWPNDEDKRRAEYNIRTQLDALLKTWNSAATAAPPFRGVGDRLAFTLIRTPGVHRAPEVIRGRKKPTKFACDRPKEGK